MKWYFSLSSPPDAMTLLIGLGAQKAGTTWLHAYLGQHPQVHVPRCKETHYFDVLFEPRPHWLAERRRAQLEHLDGSLRVRAADIWRTALADHFSTRPLPLPSGRELRRLVAMHDTPDPEHQSYWRVLLSGYRGQPLVADITPGYDLLNPDQFREMAQVAEGVKFLYLLRDPVDRAISNIRMHYQSPRGPEATGQSYREFLDEILAGKHRHVIRRSDYSVVLKNLEEAVPESQRLYLFYETMFSDQAMVRLCDFLGLEFRSGDYGTVIFQGEGQQVPQDDVEQALIRQLARVYQDMAGRYGDALPPRWRARMQ